MLLCVKSTETKTCNFISPQVQLCTKSKILAPKSDWLVVVCSYFYRITNTLLTPIDVIRLYSIVLATKEKQNLQKVENQPHEEKI